MPYAPPAPREMFSHIQDPSSVAAEFERYLDKLGKACKRADEGRDFFQAARAGGEGKIVKNAFAGRDAQQRREAIEARFERLSKSLTGAEAASIQADLDAMKADLAKEWDVAFPETSGFTIAPSMGPIDLEGPAKLIVPRETPLINMLPRDNTGKGTAINYRRITGWSNANVGGVPDTSSFFNSEFPSSQSTNNLPGFGGYSNTSGGITSGGISLRRPNKITYTADAHTVTFMEEGISDEVSTKAYYVGQGYQDPRQLSATAMLWAHKMAEEKNKLYGRGTTAFNYTGPVSAPGNPTCANASGGSISNGTYYTVITAVASGGESVTNATQQSATVSSGSLSVTLPSLPAGATGFNIYVSAASGTGGPYYFQQSVPAGYAGSAIILTALSTSSATLPSIAATGDTTANPNGYDGMLTVFLNPALSGYVGTYSVAGTLANSLNSVGGSVAGTTACGDTPWQTAFATLYGASTNPGNYAMSTGGLASTVWPWAGAGAAYGQKLLARPRIVFVDGVIRAAMGTFVRTNKGTAAAYRLEVPAPDASGSGMNIGAIVNGIANQTTGDMVDFQSHPWMPPGASIIYSPTLPMPDTEIPQTVVVKNVQDYMYEPWARIQHTWDASTYQFGAPIFYAPAWSGALVGLLA